MVTQLEMMLIVDDEPDCREECAEVVGQLGYHAVEAASGPEALALLAEFPAIRLVMTDVRMPGMDGLEFMSAAMERFGPSRELSFIVLTGHASLDLAVEALRFDAVDFLSKPVGRKQIVEAVGRARAALGRHNEATPIDLGAITGQLDQLAKTVSRLKEKAVAETPPHARALDAAFVNSIIKSRRLRDRFFESSMFSDPAWDILLDLMAGELDGRSTSISSLCVAAAVPATTALRWIKAMTDSNMLERVPDRTDGRRVLVRLAPATREMMTRYLETVKGRIVA